MFFGIPGKKNPDLLDAFSRSKTVKLILTRYEQPAGFMAATYGRLTSNTSVRLSPVGPGVTLLVTAGAYAYLGGMPMLMITGQKSIKKSKQGHFQILEVREMMAPCQVHSSTGIGRKYPLAYSGSHSPSRSAAPCPSRHDAFPRRHPVSTVPYVWAITIGLITHFIPREES